MNRSRPKSRARFALYLASLLAHAPGLPLLASAQDLEAAAEAADTDTDADADADADVDTDLDTETAIATAAEADVAAFAEEASAPVVSTEPSASDKDVEAAREHFQRGTDYYRDGDYRAALIEFERAHALRHTFRLLYNLGQVSYELRDYAAAERHFRAYLVEGEDEITPERRDEVMRELERLKERVASLQIKSTPGGANILLDDRPFGTTPFRDAKRVSAGRRTIVAELPGRAPLRRTIDLVGGESKTLDLRFGPPLIAAASVDPESASAAPWITGIASGVFAIGAGAFGYSAWQDSVSYDEQLGSYTNHDRLNQLASRSQTKAIVADALLGAAVVSLAVTAILLLSDDDEDEDSPSQAPLHTPSFTAQPPAARAF